MKYTIGICLFVFGLCFAQFQSISETPSIAFAPILSEKRDAFLLFEAHAPLSIPISYPFRQLSLNSDANPFLGNIFYAALNYDPTIRMYSYESNPVVMPNYKVFVSFGWAYGKENGIKIGVQIDNGHYSNGQEGCTFMENEVDGSDACREYISNINFDTLDFSKSINRINGDYSSNFTRIRGKLTYPSDKYNSVQLLIDYTKLIDKIFFAIPIGGFSKRGRDYYPINQYEIEIGYEKSYMHYDGKENFNSWRNALALRFMDSKINKLDGANFKFMSQYKWYNGYGLFFLGEYGTDQYNLRFVDQILRVGVGMTMQYPGLLN